MATITQQHLCKVCGAPLRSNADLEREIWALKGNVSHQTTLESYSFCSDACEEIDNAIRDRLARAHGWVR